MARSGTRSLGIGSGAWLASTALVFACESSSSSGAGGSFDFDSGGGFDVTTTPPEEGGSPSDSGRVDATAADTSTADAAEAGTPLFTVDAGPGCVPLTSENALSPASAGLPASGLALWLRADRGVYGAPAAGGGQEVCAWLDLSGGTTVLANQGPTSRPAWLPTAVGGNPALQFRAQTEALVTGGVLGIAATSARTFVAVEMLTSANGRFDPIQQGQGGSPGTYIMIDANTWQTVGNVEGAYVTNNSFDTSSATTTAGARVHVLTVGAMTLGATLDGAVDYRIDGVSMPLSLRAGGGSFQDFSLANYTAVGGFATPSMGGTVTGGMVAEVLVYNRALTPLEVTAMETALKTRYGTL